MSTFHSRRMVQGSAFDASRAVTQSIFGTESGRSPKRGRRWISMMDSGLARSNRFFTRIVCQYNGRNPLKVSEAVRGVAGGCFCWILAILRLRFLQPVPW